MSWENISTLNSIEFVCGYCGRDISSEKGYEKKGHQGSIVGSIRVCHKCDKPSYITYNGVVTPGATQGKRIKYLPPSVEGLYEEIRQCFSINAYTSIIMCSRKLLMHIARESGAAENLSFGKYVQYLKDEGYVTRPSFPLVEAILKYGNIANHQIEEYSKEDAKLIVVFLQSILENIYELPQQHKELITKE